MKKIFNKIFKKKKSKYATISPNLAKKADSGPRRPEIDHAPMEETI